MANKKLLTFVFLLGITLFDYFNQCGSISFLDVNSNGHNVKCLMEIIKRNFKRNTTVTIFLSSDLENSQMKSDLINNIFNSINYSVYIYTELSHKRVCACMLL